MDNVSIGSAPVGVEQLSDQHIQKMAPQKKKTASSKKTFKYMVSKVLGKGVCGEVRLCFRIPDLHSVAINLFGGGRFRGMLNFAYKGGGGLRHMLKIAVKRGGGV